MGFLLRLRSGKVPQFALRGESPGFPPVAAGFLSSYDGDLRDPLVGPQGGPVSPRVTRGLLRFVCSHCRGQGPHLELRPETPGSSPGPTGISGFLCSIHRGVRASSRVEPCKSTLLSSRKISVRLPVGLTIGIGVFLSRYHSAVTPAIMF